MHQFKFLGSGNTVRRTRASSRNVDKLPSEVVKKENLSSFPVHRSNCYTQYSDTHALTITKVKFSLWSRMLRNILYSCFQTSEVLLGKVRSKYGKVATHQVCCVLLCVNECGHVLTRTGNTSSNQGSIEFTQFHEIVCVLMSCIAYSRCSDVTRFFPRKEKDSLSRS